MRYLCPGGLGDISWAILKLQDINKHLDPNGTIDIRIACCDANNQAEARALDFVSRFTFVNSVKMYEVPKRGQAGAVLLPGTPTDENGYFRYLPDGPPDYPEIDYVLIPNTPLERGVRLENWLPEFVINWGIMKQFKFHDEELAEAEKFDKPYVSFYLGSLSGNTTDGHNRNSLWKPENWIELGELIADKYNVDILVVGSNADVSYYKEKIEPLLKRPWFNMIDSCSIGLSYALTRKSRFMISYQSGMGIVSSYFGVPLGIFWRARNDSISPIYNISFEESMASAWADPEMIKNGKHLSLIYGRHDIKYIMDEIGIRKW